MTTIEPMQLCGRPAVARYVWPMMETIDVCEECSRYALGVATAMGFRLGSLPLPDGSRCTQRRKDESS